MRWVRLHDAGPYFAGREIFVNLEALEWMKWTPVGTILCHRGMKDRQVVQETPEQILGLGQLPIIEVEPMPWTEKDAIHKTKKAKSAKAKRQWRDVANSVLAKTGDDARAIKSANAVIAKRKKKG